MRIRNRIEQFFQPQNSQRGFTLLELIIVIAIIGLLAIMAVPIGTTLIQKTKVSGFDRDKIAIQAIVDEYHLSGLHTYKGDNQYPIKGATAAGTLDDWTDADTSSTLATPLDPLLGTLGGNPKWRDGGNGFRDTSEDNLNAEAEAIAGSGSGWYVVKVPVNNKDYAVDPRNYFIDFDLLKTDKIIERAPASASLDNTGGAATGSYSWYVDSNGLVQALYYYFPTNGIAPNGGNDNRGSRKGIYP